MDTEKATPSTDPTSTDTEPPRNRIQFEYRLAYTFLPQNDHMTHHYWYKKAFNDEEIEKIKQIWTHFEPLQASVGEENVVDTKIRTSKVVFVPKADETKWLYEKVMGFIYHANVTFFHFDVFAAVEDIQLAKYQADVNGHYDWHVDFGSKVHSCRKLSLSVQLTDPGEYEGGELHLMTGREPEVMVKEKGDVVVFPSYMLHRVTPVTKGERMSLVTWMHGLPFR